jgi:hypothetical protein
MYTASFRDVQVALRGLIVSAASFRNRAIVYETFLSLGCLRRRKGGEAYTAWK